VVRHAFQGNRPRVFCRAGAVPRCSDWLSRVLETLRREQSPLLFANAANANLLGPKGVLGIPVLALLSSDAPHWADRVVAAVVPARSDPDRAPVPRVYTLEAFLLAQGLQGSGSAASVRLVPDATFVHSGTGQRPDEFYARLDAYSLQQAFTEPLASKRRPRHHPRRMTA
jgi:hypothetical protein